MSYAVVNDGAGGCRKNHGISRTRGDEAASAGFGIYSGRKCACSRRESRRDDLNGERCKDCTESGIGQPYYGGKLGGG